MKLTKVEKSWVVYDVGDSGLTMLQATLIPLFFASIVSSSSFDANETLATVLWSFGYSASMLIVALLMPIVGSIADYEGNKKKFFVGFLGTSIVLLLLFGIPDNWIIFLVIYILVSVTQNSAFICYDGFLPDVTDNDRMDYVSTSGYAWGYIGSCVPFVACVAIYAAQLSGILPISEQMTRVICFLITAVWWLLFSIPMIVNVHQKNFKPREAKPVKTAFLGISCTAKELFQNKEIACFLLALFLYTNAVYGLISEASIFASSVGVDSVQILLALVVTQVIAFPATIVFGKLCGRVGTKKMITFGVVIYLLIILYAVFVFSNAVDFWILAVGAGLIQGGVQGSSRSYFGKIIPKEKANEYFAIYNLVLRVAAVAVTFVIGLVTQLTGSMQIGFFVVTLYVAPSLFFLKKLKSD